MASGSYICAYCGATNELEIDASAGHRQEYVEDCQTCCRPNLLLIILDEDGEVASIDAEPENA